MPKSTSPHELADALKTMMESGPSSGPSSVSPDQAPVIALEGVHLTRREAQIARDLAHGHSITAIAETLGISKKTAAIHRDNLRGKLNCATSSELIALLARALKP
ncbi:MAG: response regulator transcription factor [Rhodobacteraceae bacterium]|nr:MAG: response regulator transcription factor [Paracoccaceae bacterium]